MPLPWGAWHIAGVGGWGQLLSFSGGRGRLQGGKVLGQDCGSSGVSPGCPPGGKHEDRQPLEQFFRAGGGPWPHNFVLEGYSLSWQVWLFRVTFGHFALSGSHVH